MKSAQIKVVCDQELEDIAAEFTEAEPKPSVPFCELKLFKRLITAMRRNYEDVTDSKELLFTQSSVI